MAAEGNNLFRQSTSAMREGLPSEDFFKDAIATARKRAKLLQGIADLEEAFCEKHDYVIGHNGPDDNDNDPTVHQLYQMAEAHIPELLDWEDKVKESIKKRKLLEQSAEITSKRAKTTESTPLNTPPASPPASAAAGGANCATLGDQLRSAMDKRRVRIDGDGIKKDGEEDDANAGADADAE